MINKILEMAARVAQDAEVMEVTSQETPVEFENNKLKSVSTRSAKGYALRIVKDGRIGFSSTTKPDGAAELVEHALDTVQFGQEANFELPSQPAVLPNVKVYDEEVVKISVEQLVEAGQALMDGIRSNEPDAQVSVWIDKACGTQRLVNTRGLDVLSEGTYYSIGASLELIQGTDMLQIWDGLDSRSKIDIDELIKAICEKAALGKNIVPIDTRTMPVIFTPKGFEMTCSLPFGIAFNGKEVLQGATPVSDKLGKQALDPRLSVYDDGIIDFSTGSRPFDDEGVPANRMPLVENGVVMNFIYDLATAAKAGAKPTGNGHRGLGSLPNPGYNSIVFQPGDTSLEDMIKGVKYGLLVDQTLGAWAGNVRSGEFSGNVHYGLKIENGELVGRVKDVMVAGNVFDALKNIEAIENISHRQSGGKWIPHILFSGLSVATR